MDAVNDDSIHTIVIMSSAQVGKTEILNNILGYFVDKDPSPILLLQPTIQMAETWSKDRLAPMIRDTPCLRGKIKDAKSRDSGNTILHKQFPGGHITMAGANSPASLASRPVRIVGCDEVDRYPVSAGTEGDPVDLAGKRSTTFWNRKLILTSTPTVKDASRIESAWESSDQRRFFLPCPHCEELQHLKWSQVEWPDNEPDQAYYVCEHCGVILTEADKPGMLLKGQWIATAPFDGTAGFHLNELYSPWKSWVEVVKDFLKAKKLPETLKVWVNTSLGETWEERGEKLDEDKLLSHREKYNAPVPYEALILTAGVDVQADRIELEVKGWGKGEESWGIDYRVLWGDTTQYDVWQALDDVLSESWVHESGLRFQISAACIDSGYQTQMVYDFVKTRASKRVFAVKGIHTSGAPIISSPSHKKTGKNARSIELFSVGVDEAKGIIHARLSKHEPGPGYYHFPLVFDEEYFKQLTAEKIITRYHKGFAQREWVKTRPRNEALDINVYAYAALKLVNPVFDALASRIPEKGSVSKPAINTQPVQTQRKVRSRGFSL